MPHCVNIGLINHGQAYHTFLLLSRLDIKPIPDDFSIVGLPENEVLSQTFPSLDSVSLYSFSEANKTFTFARIHFFLSRVLKSQTGLIREWASMTDTLLYC